MEDYREYLERICEEDDLFNIDILGGEIPKSQRGAVLPTACEIKNSDKIHRVKKDYETAFRLSGLLESDAVLEMMDKDSKSEELTEAQKVIVNTVKQYRADNSDKELMLPNYSVMRQAIIDTGKDPVEYDVDVLGVLIDAHKLNHLSLGGVIQALIATMFKDMRNGLYTIDGFSEYAPKYIIEILSNDLSAFDNVLEDFIASNDCSDNTTLYAFKLLSTLNTAKVDKNLTLIYDPKIFADGFLGKNMNLGYSAQERSRKITVGKDIMLKEASAIILEEILVNRKETTPMITTLRNIPILNSSISYTMIDRVYNNNNKLSDILNNKKERRIATALNYASKVFVTNNNDENFGKVDLNKLDSIINNHPMAKLKDRLDNVIKEHLNDAWDADALAEFSRAYLKALTLLHHNGEEEMFVNMAELLSVTPLVNTNRYGTKVKMFGIQSVVDVHDDRVNELNLNVEINDDNQYALDKWTPFHDANITVIKNLTTGITNNATFNINMVKSIDKHSDMIPDMHEYFKHILASHFENTVSEHDFVGSIEPMSDRLMRKIEEDSQYNFVVGKSSVMTGEQLVLNNAIALDDLSTVVENNFKDMYDISNEDYLSMMIAAGYFDIPLNVITRLKYYGIGKESCYNVDTKHLRFPQTSVEALLPELYSTTLAYYGYTGKYIPFTVAQMLSANKDDLKAIENINKAVSENGGASFQSIYNTDKLLKHVSSYYETPVNLTQPLNGISTDMANILMPNISKAFKTMVDTIGYFDDKDISNSYNNYFNSVIGDTGMHGTGGSVITYYNGHTIDVHNGKISTNDNISKDIIPYLEMVKNYGRNMETPLSMPCYKTDIQNTGSLIDLSTRFQNRFSQHELDYNEAVARDFIFLDNIELLQEVTYSERKMTDVRYDKFIPVLSKIEKILKNDKDSNLNLSKILDFTNDDTYLKPESKELVIDGVKYLISSNRGMEVFRPMVCDEKNYLTIECNGETVTVHGLNNGYYDCLNKCTDSRLSMYDNVIDTELVNDKDIRNEYIVTKALTPPNTKEVLEKDESPEMEESESEMGLSPFGNGVSNNVVEEIQPVEEIIEEVQTTEIDKGDVMEQLENISNEIKEVEVKLSSYRQTLSSLQNRDDNKSIKRVGQTTSLISQLENELTKLINEKKDLTSHLPEEVVEVVEETIVTENLPTKEEVESEINLTNGYISTLYNNLKKAENELVSLNNVDTSTFNELEIDWYKEDVTDAEIKISDIKSELDNANDNLDSLNNILIKIRRHAFATGNIEEINKFFISREDHDEIITTLRDDNKSLLTRVDSLVKENQVIKENLMDLINRVTELETNKVSNNVLPKAPIAPKPVELEVLEPIVENTPEIKVCNSIEKQEYLDSKRITRDVHYNHCGIAELLVLSSTGVVVSCSNKQFITNTFRPNSILLNDELMASLQFKYCTGDVSVEFSKFRNIDGSDVVHDIAPYNNINNVCVIPNVSSERGLNGINVVYTRGADDAINKEPALYIDTNFLKNRSVYEPLIEAYTIYMGERLANQSMGNINAAWVDVIKEASALKTILTSTRRLKEYDINSDEIHVNNMVIKSKELFDANIEENNKSKLLESSNNYIITPRSVANYYVWSPMPGDEPDIATIIDQHIDASIETPVYVKQHSDGTEIRIPLADTQALSEVHVTRGKDNSPLRPSPAEIELETIKAKASNDNNSIDRKEQYEIAKFKRDMELLDYSRIIDELKTKLKIEATEAELKALAGKYDAKEREIAINTFASAKSNFSGSQLASAVKSIGGMLNGGGFSPLGMF